MVQPEAQKVWAGMRFPPEGPFSSPPSLPSCPPYFHEYLLITYYVTGVEAAKLSKTYLVPNLVEHESTQTRTKKCIRTLQLGGEPWKHSDLEMGVSKTVGVDGT